MTLAQPNLQNAKSPLDAYMTLQRALLERYTKRHPNEENRFFTHRAKAFRRRYGRILELT